jgi:hypothetical protein
MADIILIQQWFSYADITVGASKHKQNLYNLYVTIGPKQTFESLTSMMEDRMFIKTEIKMKAQLMEQNIFHSL